MQALQAVVLVGLAGRLATSPFAIAVYRHRLDYGLTTQSTADFTADAVRGELVAAVGTSIGVPTLLAIARRCRRACTASPAWSGGAGGAGVVCLPLVVEPVFNEFEAPPAGELRAEILRLADVEGVPVDEVSLPMHPAVQRPSTRKSQDSGARAGSSSTTRLVESLPQGQALTVVAHDLAHARHGDVVVGTALGAAAGVGCWACWPGPGSTLGERGLVTRPWCRSC